MYIYIYIHTYIYTYVSVNPYSSVPEERERLSDKQLYLLKVLCSY